MIFFELDAVENAKDFLKFGVRWKMIFFKLFTALKKSTTTSTSYPPTTFVRCIKLKIQTLDFF